MSDYRNGITEDDLQFTKDALIKSNAREYETLWALQGILQDINEFDLPADYLEKQQEILSTMTVEEHRELIQKFIDPEKMFYVVVGDAATQLQPLEEIGLGEPEIVAVN